MQDVLSSYIDDASRVEVLVIENGDCNGVEHNPFLCSSETCHRSGMSS